MVERVAATAEGQFVEALARYYARPGAPCPRATDFGLDADDFLRLEPEAMKRVNELRAMKLGRRPPRPPRPAPPRLGRPSGSDTLRYSCGLCDVSVLIDARSSDSSAQAEFGRRHRRVILERA